MKNNSSIGTRFQILFLIFTVLGIYYPAVLSPFTQVDDPRIMGFLEDTNPRLLDILLPGQSFYYRPLILLTFYADKYLWGLEPSFMHLENVLLHVCNTLLVFFISKKIFQHNTEPRSELALLCALLFAVHPINTEAVSWVSGRTDPLATVFVLLGAYIVVRRGRDVGIYDMLFAAGAIFIGCLAKEVAFFFFPLAYVLILRQQEKVSPPFISRHNCRNFIVPSLPFISGMLLYLGLRFSGTRQQDGSFAKLLMVQKHSAVDTFYGAFNAFGFYVRKLAVPVPLNFVITTINSYYFLLGISVLLFLAWRLYRKNSVYTYFFLCSLFLTAPGVLVAVKNIAWTPVAERYIYCSSAFFVIAAVGGVSAWAKESGFSRYVSSLLLMLAGLFAVVTAQRNLMWQDTLLLYEDTAKKSPHSAKVQNEYAVALIERGRLEEASRQLEIGRKLDKDLFLIPLNQARIKLAKNDVNGAILLLEATSKNRESGHPEILKMMARIRESQLKDPSTQSDYEWLRKELLSLYYYIYLYTKDPFIAYRRGQLLLVGQEHDKASHYFRLAYEGAPQDAFYKAAAKKLAEKLRDR